MDVTPLIKSDSQVIQGYTRGTFRISGELYQTPVIVFPDRVEEWKFTGDPDAVTAEDFEQVLKLGDELDVVLFGGGEKMRFVKSDVRSGFSARNMMIEPMDSGAACRTYNVLLAEDRRVAALLLPV